MQWTKWTLPTQLAAHASRCAQAWVRDDPAARRRPAAGRARLPCPAVRAAGTRSSGSRGRSTTPALTGRCGTGRQPRRSTTSGRSSGPRSSPPCTPPRRCTVRSTGSWPYQYPIRFHFGVMVRGEAHSHDPDRGRATDPRPRVVAHRPPADLRRPGRRARGETAVAAQRGPLPVQRDLVPVVVDLQGRTAVRPRRPPDGEGMVVFVAASRVESGPAAWLPAKHREDCGTVKWSANREACGMVNDTRG